MWDRVDTVVDGVEAGDEEVEKEDVCHQKVDGHNDGCDPTTDVTGNEEWSVNRFAAFTVLGAIRIAFRIDVRSEYLTVQHEVRLK